MPFTSDDRKALEDAVRAAESRTSAEIVVAVVEAAEDYGLYALLWAAGLGFVLAGVIALAWPAMHVRVAFLCAGGSVLLMAALFHLPAIRTRLAPRHVRAHAAARAARVHFAREVAGRTAEKHGVLVFAAIAERYLEIVPDGAIAQRIPPRVWEDVVGEAISEVQAGRLAAGLARAVDRCAGELAPHFPRRPDDRNELPDAVVFTER